MGREPHKNLFEYFILTERYFTGYYKIITLHVTTLQNRKLLKNLSRADTLYARI